MKGTKYLSDVLDVSQLRTGELNIIDAPCGCGKTTCAINKIAELASSPRKVLYLIDTRIGKERLAREPGLIKPCVFIDGPLDGEPWEKKLVYELRQEKIPVMTYALFGILCSDSPDFIKRFEIIICDEPQSLVFFSKIGNVKPNEIDAHKAALFAICKNVYRGKILFVAITATPQPLDAMKCIKRNVPIDRTDLRHYEERETIPYARIEDVLNVIHPGQRGGLYAQHVHTLRKYGEMLQDRGFHPLILWSKNYEISLNAEQLAAWKHIIEHEEIPEEYDVFLFNATAETSINIRSHMDFFIAHNTGETHVTQSRGRYRGDLDRLFLYDPSGPCAIVVPDSFLNRPLFRKDLKELRDYLKLPKDAKGHPPSIDNMLRQISDNNYSYEEGIHQRKKIIVIRKNL